MGLLPEAFGVDEDTRDKLSMSDDRKRVNTIGNVSGTNVNITQVYAPGQTGIRAELLPKIGNARPFSIDWLMFTEQSIPFLERKKELAAIHAFLMSPAQFAWWAIVGEGGAGKSRLALEAIQRLPSGWGGGFMTKESISAGSAATWTPSEHTLWVVDYAAGYQEQLRQVIAVFARLGSASNLKVRLLLIERGYSQDSGWWAELTRTIARESVAVNLTRYRAPLVLSPRVVNARSFLKWMAKSLSRADAEALQKAIKSVTDSWLADRSDHGNPLILQLLASELLSGNPLLAESRPARGRDIVEAYLGRELGLLRERCRHVGLRFADTLHLLFVTTSAFPLYYLFDDDLVMASTEQDKFVAIKGKDGKYRLPTFGEMTKMGVDLTTKQNRGIRENLSTITGAEDVALYFAMLDEVGISRSKRWSIQPDLLGEALIRLIVNPQSAGLWLRQRRGAIHREKVATLVEGAALLAPDQSYSNWARLDDETLVALTGHFKLRGKSIRLMLVTIRQINAKRERKVPFDSSAFDSRAHPGNDKVRAYFEAVRAVLPLQFDDRAARAFAGSEHAWLAPYFEFLLDLRTEERLSVGRLICRIESPATLSRLTNTANFVFVLASFLQEILSEDAGDHWLANGASLGVFVDEAIAFVCTRVYPALVTAEDTEFRQPYRDVARTLILCSYGILNNQFGREETGESRCRIGAALDTVARSVLVVAPDAEELANLDRNMAALLMAEALDPVQGSKGYAAALGRMAGYASAKDYTATLADWLTFGGKRKSILTLRLALNVLSEARPELVDGEALAAVLATVASHRDTEALDPGEIAPILISAWDAAGPAFQQVQAIEASNDIETFLNHCALASNTNAALRDQLSARLQVAREAIDKGECSAAFTRAILLVTALMAAIREVHGEAIPAGVVTSELKGKELSRALRGIAAPASAQIAGILIFEAAHTHRDGSTIGAVQFALVPKEGEFLAGQAVGLDQDLADRLRAYLRKREHP